MKTILRILMMSLVVNTAKSNAPALRRCLSFGHRGFKGKFVENSLESFRAAVNAGLDGVELDVWRCKTGEIVLFHDHKLERLTNGVGYTSDKTFTELRSLSLANGERIPTLVEVLKEINRKCKVNIELKGYDTALSVVNIIKDFIIRYGWSESDFIVTSFNHPELEKFHKAMPNTPFGPIIEGVPLGLAEFAQKMNASHLVISNDYAPKNLVDDAKLRGLKVFVYTVNDVDDIRQIKHLGVDAIISDFPELILE